MGPPFTFLSADEGSLIKLNPKTINLHARVVKLTGWGMGHTSARKWVTPQGMSPTVPMYSSPMQGLF